MIGEETNTNQESSDALPENYFDGGDLNGAGQSETTDPNGQSGNQDPEQNQTQPENNNDQDATPKLYAGKFKSVEDMERAYNESQRKISEQGEALAKMVDSVSDNTELENTSDPEKSTLDTFLENPEAFIQNAVKNGIEKEKLVELEYAKAVVEGKEFAANYLKEKYGEEITPEVIKEIDAFTESNSILNFLKSAPKKENYQAFGNLGQMYADIAELATLAFIGSKNKELLNDAKAEVRREAKREELLKGRTGTLMPTRGRGFPSNNKGEAQTSFIGSLRKAAE